MNPAECICISLDCYSFVSLTKWLFNVIRHEAYGECKGEILAVKPGGGGGHTDSLSLVPPAKL